jgi:hypothetical protein
MNASLSWILSLRIMLRMNRISTGLLSGIVNIIDLSKFELTGVNI